MKEKIITFTFLGYILLFSILHITLEDKTISNAERRKLATFPKIQLTSEYITKIDKYLLDHFPFRNEFRSIKANFNYVVLNKLDNNGIYLDGNRIYKSNYPTNKDSIARFIDKIKTLEGLLTKDNNAYLMVIPDKNYYLDDKDFLQIDYEYIENQLKKLQMPSIEIKTLLNKEDYYETDTHWRQENLLKIVKKMSEVMHFDYIENEYIKNEYDDFYGVYYGESAINRKAEKLIYLTNETHQGVTVNYLENANLHSLYSKDKLTGMDAYEVYLDGASSFIEIINSNANTEKELIIFRDSFGSSLAPLLIDYYSKITLVDNRYINSENFTKLIAFKDQDVLFLYSTLLINDSASLKG